MAGCRAQLNYSRSNGVCRVKRCDLGLVSRREMRLGALSSPGKIEGIIGASPWAGVFGNGTGLTGRSPGPPVLPMRMGQWFEPAAGCCGVGAQAEPGTPDAGPGTDTGFCPVQGAWVEGIRQRRRRSARREIFPGKKNSTGKPMLAVTKPSRLNGQNPGEHLAASHDFVPQQSSELDCRLPQSHPPALPIEPSLNKTGPLEYSHRNCCPSQDSPFPCSG